MPFGNWLKMKWRIYFCDKCKNKRFLYFEDYRKHTIMHEL